VVNFWAKQTITKHLKGHVGMDLYFPGNYYSDNADHMAAFLRGELVFSW